MKMTRLRNIIALTAFALMVLALPSVASAQWRDRDRNDDYYGNNRNNRNIRATIQNLKNRSRNFERRIERIDDRRDDRRDRNDRYDPWGRNDRNRGYASDNLENLAERFRDATDDLAGAYGNGRNLNGSRDEAQRVLQLGSQIDNELSRTRSNRNAQNEWNQIRYDLRVISDVYGYGNYRNNRSGDWRNRIPFPLPF
jgi:hypothetical protein